MWAATPSVALDVGQGTERLPSFLVIGAMKAGTTSLFHYLRRHPQVYMSPLKELDFFAEEGNWGRGLDWYRRQFARAPADALAVGEASTAYTKHPHQRGVPERIASVLPNVRLIYVVRDPIERIRSQYEHRVAVGAETLPIERAVFSNPIYLDCSRYAMQLERYDALFPRERILVITSEALRGRRLDTMRTVFGFLGVDEGVVPENLATEFYRTSERATWSPAMWRFRRRLRRLIPAAKRAKELVDTRLPKLASRLRGAAEPPATPAPSIPDELRSALAAELAPDVRRLSAYLPSDFDGWGYA